ncbi:glutathione-dependent formaldehyde dehydrogenase [Kocuria coralli]|uniref:Glutathione-dependent formaldehyde dehydrogenase n=1 Tax=Kocuria coralli TaxID=1461025 RepID=A0A5J5KYZ4_9MICC|nr:zinc-dependent alcohol dehydrogenase [Kocuria coralli]KAA9394843.1 glutathione-dependent formaldehyde dehydrogenase [Kocuria coralli]
MRALTWQAPGKVEVVNVPIPQIQESTDAIIRVSSTAICGSDLHLYNVFGPYMDQGDVLGHEFMGTVEQVGSGVGTLKEGDRVVVPFNISCGRCWMCARGFFAQCETTQNTDFEAGASLFGFSKMYGQVPGGQAEYVRVPHADFGPVKVPDGFADERALYLSDILPTAWQGVKWADVPEGGSLAVIGLGPVGQLSVRSARQQGNAGKIIAVDMVDERLELARKWGAEVIDLRKVDSVSEAIFDLTDGRGADSTLDAVGMEAHGNPVAETVVKAVSKAPDVVARPMMEKAGVDRLDALLTAIQGVRRSGTVSVSGVYAGNANPMPLKDIFDKGLRIAMGQCHVRQWTDELSEIVFQGEDVLGLEDLATHRIPLSEAPAAYEKFMKKEDGCIKVVLDPTR